MLTTSLIALTAITVTSVTAMIRTWIRERAYNERFRLMVKRVKPEHRHLLMKALQRPPSRPGGRVTEPPTTD